MLMSSPSVARWKSGSICSRVIRPGVDVDDDAVEHRHDRSPGSGNFETRSVGWPTAVLTRYISPTSRSSCCCVAIFFESGDHEHDRAIAAAPAGVVGGVAEILHAVGRQRRLLAASRCRAPTGSSRGRTRRASPSGDMRERLAVARRGASCAAASASAASGRRWRRGQRRITGCRAFAALRVARPSLCGEIEAHGRAVRRQIHRLEGKAKLVELCCRRRRERSRELRVIEGARARLFDRIDEDEFGAGRKSVAVPEAIVGKPGRRNGSAGDERRHRGREEALRAGVVVGGNGRLLLREERCADDRGRKNSENEMSCREDATRKGHDGAHGNMRAAARDSQERDL